MEKSAQYSKFIKALNQLLKACKNNPDGEAAVEQKLVDFEKQFVLPYSTDPWIIALNLNLKKYQICVLAHSCKPVRCIAMIEPNMNADKLKRSALTWVFRKITFAEDNKDSIKLDPISKTQHSLYAEKRGFWVILNVKPEIISNVYEDVSKRAEIFNLYKTYVKGMEICPANESLMKGYGEQFNLKEYPTKEWSDSVLYNSQSKTINSNRKKKQKLSRDDNKENIPPSHEEPHRAPVTDPPLNVANIAAYRPEAHDKEVFPPTTVTADTFLDLFIQHEKALEAAMALSELGKDETLENDPFASDYAV